MRKYPYKDAKIRPEDHAILRTLAYHLNEPHARILGRLIRQEAKRLGLAERQQTVQQQQQKGNEG